MHQQKSEIVLKKRKRTENKNKIEKKVEESDSEIDGINSFANESSFSSNIGDIREFSINTKENRDSWQDKSKREEKSHSSLQSTIKESKLRHTLTNYINTEEPIGSKDSICCEGIPTKVRCVTNMNFISASNNIKFHNNEGKFYQKINFI